ncbi:hypothetical protein [Salinisphaera hydrothermalis]|uniref:hypothetical protein n=1 Tax=Salinisphaera hydrothermalis TaxID=563188 RepID=UPI00333E3A33
MSYQAHMWRLIRAQPSGISIHALAGDTGASMKSARHYVYALLSAGVLEVSEQRPDQTHRYRLVRDTGPVPPRHDGDQLVTAPTTRYRIWQAIRVMRSYTVRDLVATAECRVEPVRHLVRDLVDAGYARVTQPAHRPSGRHARYQLLRDTGPLPLVRHKSGALTDPNTHEEINL